MLQFHSVCIGDRDRLLPFLTEKDRGCEYTFSNIYLYRNYFGIVNPNQTPDQWDAWSFRSRTALLNSGDNTQIITNPCRVNPRNVGNIGDNTLYIDTTPGLLTYIPNGDSAALTVDTTTLLDSGETVTINVTDAKDNVQATWTIN